MRAGVPGRGPRSRVDGRMLNAKKPRHATGLLLIAALRGGKGIRTPDLLHAMETRYQLRHTPVGASRVRATRYILGRLPCECKTSDGVVTVDSHHAVPALSEARSPVPTSPGRSQLIHHRTHRRRLLPCGPRAPGATRSMAVSGEDLGRCRRRSRRRPIVLIHGFRGDHHGLALIAHELRDRDVWVPDLPGFGSAPPPERGLDLAAFTAHIQRSRGACEAASGVRPILIGHSFGSVLAAHAYAQTPEIAQGLGSLSPSSSRHSTVPRGCSRISPGSTTPRVPHCRIDWAPRCWRTLSSSAA